MMALHVGLRRAVPPAAIVGYSGVFVLPEKAKADAVAGEIKSKPPVLLIHGDQDELIPVQALLQGRRTSPRWRFRSSGTFPRASATASTRKACATAATFLARRFGLRS